MNVHQGAIPVAPTLSVGFYKQSGIHCNSDCIKRSVHFNILVQLN